VDEEDPQNPVEHREDAKKTPLTSAESREDAKKIPLTSAESREDAKKPPGEEEPDSHPDGNEEGVLGNGTLGRLSTSLKEGARGNLGSPEFPFGLPHGKGPDGVGGDYPEEQPPYEIPHNPLRFLKKFPKKLIPKVLKLFHLDTILQEIMLSVIAIDDETLRNEVAKELSRVADRLQEPLDKFSDMLGHSIRGVLSAAIPVLGGFYVINDMANAYKTTAETQEQALGPLNDFVTKVKDLYDSSVESNRLLSSMIYAGIDTVTDEKWKKVLEVKRNEAIGRAAEGAVEDRPADKEMARLMASGLTRNIRENLGKEEISGLLDKLRKEGPDVVSKITDLEPSEQQAALGTGESILSFLTSSLEKKYGETKEIPEEETMEEPKEETMEESSNGKPEEEDPIASKSESRVSDSDKESLKKALESIKKLAEMTPDILKALE
jgi:hypothetical protein